MTDTNPKRATGVQHASDCAVHNAPAYPNGPCDCDPHGECALEINRLRDALRAALRVIESTARGHLPDDAYRVIEQIESALSQPQADVL